MWLWLVFVLTAELTHQDIGQMDMYVRMYDDLRRGKDDSPSVGIILCEDKDHSVARIPCCTAVNNYLQAATS